MEDDMNIVNADIIQISRSESNKESNIETVELSLDILEIAEYLLAENELNKKISFQLRKINYSYLFNALISMSQNEIIEAIDLIEKRSSLLKKNKFLECKKHTLEITNEINSDHDKMAQGIFTIIAGTFSIVEEYAKIGEIKHSLKRFAKDIMDGEKITTLVLLHLITHLNKDAKIMAYDAIYWLGMENHDDDKTRMFGYFHANKEEQFS
jgi:hypothetical protein